jgi:hypothetical protein
LKILSDDKLKEIGKPGRQSLFWMRKVAEAQAKLTARDIFAESDKLILEPLPSTRLSNNFGVVIRESYNELKKQFGVEDTLQNQAKNAEYLTSISQAQKED